MQRAVERDTDNFGGDLVRLSRDLQQQAIHIDPIETDNDIRCLDDLLCRRAQPIERRQTCSG